MSPRLFIASPKTLVCRRSSALCAPLICAVSIAAFLGTPALEAQTITKANNAENLNQGISWVGGAVPFTGDVALWDSTVTGANAVFLGENMSWRGLRITNPVGPVTIGAGSTLTLGAGGIDMGSASADLTLDSGLTLLGATAQSWTVGADRTLTINGTLTRSAGAALALNTAAGGKIKINSLTSSTVLTYTSLNKTDFAAIDASNNVVGGATLAGVYTQNPNQPDATMLPNLVGNFTVIDFVNSNPNGTNGVRIGSSTNLSVGGFRFNVPHETAAAWTVDLAGRNLNIGNGSILVTANVGTDDVQINGSGNIRLGAGSNLLLQQHNTAGNLILNSQITQPAGAGSSVTKVGAGKVILASSGNSYAGGTRIVEGTLQVGNGGTIGVLGGGDVTNNGTLAFNRSDNVTVIHNINGSGAVTQMGPGELTFTTNFSTYTGPTNIDGGTLTFSSLQNLGGGTAINFNGGALKWAEGNSEDVSVRTLTFGPLGGSIHTNGNNITFANAVGNSGAGGLTKLGAGTLTLGALNNNYSGSTVVSAGRLNVTGSVTGVGAISIAPGATLSGTGSLAGTGTVGSGGILSPGVTVGTITLGGLTLSSGAILNFDFSSASTYDSVVVTNPGGLTINGGGLNLFSTGTTTAWNTPGTYNLFSVNGGIQGAGVGALSVLNPAAGYDYTFGSTGSALTLTVALAGIISDWKVDAGGSWGAGANWTNGVPNQVSATARFGDVITQPRTVTLDGDRTVSSISFDSTHSYTIAQGTSGSLTLQKNTGSGQNLVIKGSHTISAPVVLGSKLSADIADGGTMTLSGAVSGANSITKVGGGSLVLSGANSYTGGTQIDAGTVEFSSLSSLGTGNIGLAGGRLRWATGNTADVSSRILTFGQGGATLDTNGNDVTLLNEIGNAGTGGLTKAGNGSLTLEGFNLYKGPTSIRGGKLVITNNSNLGDETTAAGVTLDGGTLAASGTISLDAFGSGIRPVTIGAAGGGFEVPEFVTLTVPGVITGTGALTKAGPGTLVLNGANGTTFSGPISIDDGAILLGGGEINDQQGIGTGPITFTGGTLTLNGHTGSTTPDYGVLTNALHIPEGETGTVNMTQRGGMTGALTGGGTFNLNVNYVRGNVNTNWSGFTGQINVSSTTDGVDDLRLSNFVPLNIPEARLHIGDGVFVSQIFNPPAGGETVHNIGELSGTAGAIIAGNPVADRFSDWTIGALNTNSTFAGVIQNSTGASRLTKVGSGTLTLSGANTYTGETNIEAGALLVSGSLSGTSSIAVNFGAELQLGADNALNDLAPLTLTDGVLDTDGFSDILGILSIGFDSTIDLGDAASVLRFADSTTQFWSGTLSITSWTGSLTGGGADQLLFGTAFGGITSDQLASIKFVNPTGLQPGRYDARMLENGEIVAVPEPTTGMTLLLGGLGMLLGRRRKRA